MDPLNHAAGPDLILKLLFKDMSFWLSFEKLGSRRGKGYGCMAFGRPRNFGRPAV